MQTFCSGVSYCSSCVVHCCMFVAATVVSGYCDVIVKSIRKWKDPHYIPDEQIIWKCQLWITRLGRKKSTQVSLVHPVNFSHHSNVPCHCTGDTMRFISGHDNKITWHVCMYVPEWSYRCISIKMLHFLITTLLSSCMKQGKSTDRMPLTQALLKHLNQAVFQGGHIWGQYSFPQLIHSEPTPWGWTLDESTMENITWGSKELSRVCSLWL